MTSDNRNIITLYSYYSLVIFISGVIYYAHGFECKCGKPQGNSLSMRIVGGQPAEPHSFPWAVAIRLSDRMHCGGSIITDRHILSAGHCFKWYDAKKMDILLGLHNLDKLEDVVKRYFEKVVIHDNFKSTAVRDENDIAIGTMNEAVKFNNKIIPICLPKTHDEDYSKWKGTLVGWGRTKAAGVASKILLKATLNILTEEQCYTSRLSKFLTKSMFCAFSKGVDGCQGDSGGPLMVLEPKGRYVQIGVVSWGIGCADPLYPGVYTKVNYFIDWIKQLTSSGNTCN